MAPGRRLGEQPAGSESAQHRQPLPKPRTRLRIRRVQRGAMCDRRGQQRTLQSVTLRGCGVPQPVVVLRPRLPSTSGTEARRSKSSSCTTDPNSNSPRRSAPARSVHRDAPSVPLGGKTQVSPDARSCKSNEPRPGVHSRRSADTTVTTRTNIVRRDHGRKNCMTSFPVHRRTASPRELLPSSDDAMGPYDSNATSGVTPPG
jgi:hypothetical protein